MLQVGFNIYKCALANANNLTLIEGTESTLCQNSQYVASTTLVLPQHYLVHGLAILDLQTLPAYTNSDTYRARWLAKV